MIRSLPLPPSIVSSPSPPRSESLPSPPKRASFPASRAGHRRGAAKERVVIPPELRASLPSPPMNTSSTPHPERVLKAGALKALDQAETVRRLPTAMDAGQMVDQDAGGRVVIACRVLPAPPSRAVVARAAQKRSLPSSRAACRCLSAAQRVAPRASPAGCSPGIAGDPVRPAVPARFSIGCRCRPAHRPPRRWSAPRSTRTGKVELRHNRPCRDRCRRTAVPPGAAGQRVVAVVAVQRFVALIAIQPSLSLRPFSRIIARPHEHRVVRVRAEHRIAGPRPRIVDCTLGAVRTSPALVPTISPNLGSRIAVSIRLMPVRASSRTPGCALTVSARSGPSRPAADIHDAAPPPVAGGVEAAPLDSVGRKVDPATKKPPSSSPITSGRETLAVSLVVEGRPFDLRPEEVDRELDIG